MFDIEKATHATAFLLHLNKGSMKWLKLMKLLYLSEVECLLNHNEPLTGDRLFCLDKGPVLSSTLDLIHSGTECPNSIWNHWIKDKGDYSLELMDHVSDQQYPEELSSLSKFEMDILRQMFFKYQDCSEWDMVNITHQPTVCPEWKSPHGSATEISIKDLCKARCLSSDSAAALESALIEYNELHNFTSELTGNYERSCQG